MIKYKSVITRIRNRICICENKMADEIEKYNNTANYNDKMDIYEEMIVIDAKIKTYKECLKLIKDELKMNL